MLALALVPMLVLTLSLVVVVVLLLLIARCLLLPAPLLKWLVPWRAPHLQKTPLHLRKVHLQASSEAVPAM